MKSILSTSHKLVTNLWKVGLPLAMISSLLLGFVSAPVFAAQQTDGYLKPISEDELDLIRKDANWFDPTQPACVASGLVNSDDGSSFVPTGDTATIVAQSKRFIWNYLTAEGRLSPEVAAGIMGNMQEESGFIPTRLQGSGIQTKPTPEGVIKLGWGLVQWTPGTKILVSIDNDPFDRVAGNVGLQMDILWAQLFNPESIYVKHDLPNLSAADKPAGDALLKIQPNDPDALDKATDTFGKLYERYKGPIQPERREHARKILAEFGNGAGGVVPTDDTTSSSCSGTTGATSITPEGWAFPLQTTKGVIKGGSSNSSGTGIWCYTRQDNCHHDYNAADIHAPTGTVVVAISDGEIVYARNNSLVIKSSNPQSPDQYVFYHAHLLLGSISVARNATVRAGQPIARVGTIAEASGTAPHLHIDMQKSPPATTRPSCSGAACKPYPFLNMQPILVPAFEGLKE